MFAAIVCIKKCTEYVPVDLEMPRDIFDMAIFEQNLYKKLLLCCYVQASVHAFNRGNVHVVV